MTTMKFLLSAAVGVLFFLIGQVLQAQQTSFTVSSAAELRSALAQAFNNNVSNPALLNTITLGGNISATSQMIVNANVHIVGANNTINMGGSDRAFFIAGGNVSISHLTIQNGLAQGGAGFAAGGGGAGLGGAVFVGNGTYYGGADPVTGIAPLVAQGISVPNVTLNGVSFFNNNATGGDSPVGGLIGGGGGGMGGDSGSSTGAAQTPGYGGGGFGNGAFGSGYLKPSAGGESMINPSFS